MSEIKYSNANENIQLDNMEDNSDSENVAFINNIFNDTNIKNIETPTINNNSTLENIVNSNVFNNSMNNNTMNNNTMNNTLNNDMNNYSNNDIGILLDDFNNSNNSLNIPANTNILSSPERNINNNKNINMTVNDSMNSMNHLNNTVKEKMNMKNIDSVDFDLSTNDYTYLEDNLNKLSSTYFNNENFSKENIKIPEKMAENKVSDNFVLNFPARMSDGRLFTDYKSSGILNLYENELNSTLEYRLYLQNNAEKIMDNNYNIAESLTDCNTCPGYEIIDSKILLSCNKETCEQSINNNGIGIEVQYVQ